MGSFRVVSLHQNRVKPGDAPLPGARPHPFEQFGKLGKYARGISLGGRRLADGQTHFPGRHGKTGYGVHHQEDVIVLVAEILGDGRREIGAPHAQEGVLIRGGNNDHGFLQPFLAQIFFDELPDLPAPFSDQTPPR